MSDFNREDLKVNSNSSSIVEAEKKKNANYMWWVAIFIVMGVGTRAFRAATSINRERSVPPVNYTIPTPQQQRDAQQLLEDLSRRARNAEEEVNRLESEANVTPTTNEQSAN